jgi:hypothetical protein
MVNMREELILAYCSDFWFENAGSRKKREGKPLFKKIKCIYIETIKDD